MIERTTENPEIISTYSLTSMLQCQQSVPSSYETRSFFGASMRYIEDDSAEFLERYLAGTVIVKPTDYDTLRLFLSILKTSKYRPIKKLMKKALAKFEQDLINASENMKIFEQQTAQPVSNPEPQIENNTENSDEIVAENADTEQKTDDTDVVEIVDTEIIEPESEQIQEQQPVAEQKSVSEPETIIEPIPVATPVAEPVEKPVHTPVSKPAIQPRVESAPTPRHTIHTSSPNFSILENKKKMRNLTSAQLYELGVNLYTETGFSTSKLKNKFVSYVTTKINSVLSGQCEADEKFDILVATFAPTKYKVKYSTWMKSQEQPAATQTIITPTEPIVEPVSEPVDEEFIEPVDDTVIETPQKKSKFMSRVKGFFSRTCDAVKTVAKKAVRPLVVAGIVAVSLFAGKKVYDAATQNSAPSNPTAQQTKTPIANDTTAAKKTANFDAAQQKTVAMSHADSIVFAKSVAILNNIKSTNPIDKNMDTDAMAKKLFQRFGGDTYRVVLSGAMAPYALNNYVQFGFRPSTHNILEYLASHDLTSAQKTALNAFMADNVKNNNIDIHNLKKPTNLKELMKMRAHAQRTR